MITVKNVCKKYGSFVAVDNISFEIDDGEIIGLLGPNGAGKSTTMNMLTGFIEPTSGEILINGVNISKKSKKAKSNIGYMPENVPLYKDLTVKEFINYMAELKYVKGKDKKNMVSDIMAKTNLTDVQNKLIKNLSRGYKQRVSMAGALVGNPKILILDDSTSAVDTATDASIQESFNERIPDTTKIIISQRISSVQNANRIIVLNDGVVDGFDRHEKLLETNEIYRTIYETQMKGKEEK